MFLSAHLETKVLDWQFLSRLVTPGARFTISLCQCKPSFGVKNCCQDLLKTHGGKLALKRLGNSYLCDTPYWICICRSFPFDLYIYGRRIFKWITQHNLLRFPLVNSLVFAPKKACLKVTFALLLEDCAVIMEMRCCVCVHIFSKSPTGCSHPIGALMALRSNANWPHIFEYHL